MAIATNLTSDVRYSLSNTLEYVINQKLFNVNTILPCKVLAVNNGDIKTYDVQSLIQNISALKEPVDPPTIYKVPACVNAGSNAGVIIEYQIGDTVLVGFCQRDISVIKKLWQKLMPNSYRKFNLADGVIIGGLYKNINDINTYVKITSSEIEIKSNNLPVIINSGTGDTNIMCKNANITAQTETTITAPTINLNGNVVCNSSISANSMTINGKDFVTHTHEAGSYTAGSTAVTGTSGAVS